MTRAMRLFVNNWLASANDNLNLLVASPDFKTILIVRIIVIAFTAPMNCVRGLLLISKVVNSCAGWSAMSAKADGPSNMATKCSLFNQKQFSFLKSNLVVRTDLWTYFLKSRRAGTAAPDAISRPSTIKDFVRCANRDVRYEGRSLSLSRSVQGGANNKGKLRRDGEPAAQARGRCQSPH